MSIRGHKHAGKSFVAGVHRAVRVEIYDDITILCAQYSSRCVQAVDPVLVGKVRAKQYYSDDFDRTRNLGVLLHGDGSFSGQGVVYETLDMSALQDYTVGGIIHIVVNNQVALFPCSRCPSSLASPVNCP